MTMMSLSIILACETRHNIACSGLCSGLLVFGLYILPFLSLPVYSVLPNPATRSKNWVFQVLPHDSGLFTPCLSSLPAVSLPSDKNWQWRFDDVLVAGGRQLIIDWNVDNRHKGGTRPFVIFEAIAWNIHSIAHTQVWGEACVHA